MTIKVPFNPTDVARSIIAELHVRRLSKGNAAQLISWDSESGLYRVENERLELAAQSLLEETIDKTVESFHIREVLSAIRRNAPLISPNRLNDPQQAIVVFQNGVLDLSTMQL